MAYSVLGQGDNESEYVYRHLEDVIRRLASMPGQRVLVLVSPGFITSTLQLEASEIVDRATRANIVINTIDARGLYTPGCGGDMRRCDRIDTVRTAHISAHIRGVKPARINGVDHDVGARRAIHDFGCFELQRRGNEAGGNQYKHALSGHTRQPPDDVFQVPVNILGLIVSLSSTLYAIDCARPCAAAVMRGSL